VRCWRKPGKGVKEVSFLVRTKAMAYDATWVRGPLTVVAMVTHDKRVIPTTDAKAKIS
jgi:hypothetical protein